MEQIGLVVTNTPEYSVKVGTGAVIENNGVCKQLSWKLQGMEIIQNFFILELGGTEVVLGMDWLASQGDIEANFRSLIIKWGQKGCKKMIRGDPV